MGTFLSYPTELLSNSVNEAAIQMRHGATDVGRTSVIAILRRLPAYERMAANLGANAAREFRESLNILTNAMENATIAAVPEVQQLQQTLQRIADTLGGTSVAVTSTAGQAVTRSSSILASGIMQGSSTIGINISNSVKYFTYGIAQSSTMIRDAVISTGETMKDATDSLSKAAPYLGQYVGEKAAKQIVDMVKFTIDRLILPIYLLIGLMAIFALEVAYTLAVKISSHFDRSFINWNTVLIGSLLAIIIKLQIENMTKEERNKRSMCWLLAEFTSNPVTTDQLAIQDSNDSQQVQQSPQVQPQELLDQIIRNVENLQGQGQRHNQLFEAYRQELTNIRTSITNLQSAVSRNNSKAMDLLPAGAIMPFALHAVPTGWLPCNHTILDPSNPEHARLRELGHTFTPDLRGKVIMHPRAAMENGAVIETRLGSGTGNGAVVQHAAYQYYIKL